MLISVAIDPKAFDRSLFAQPGYRDQAEDLCLADWKAMGCCLLTAVRGCLTNSVTSSRSSARRTVNSFRLGLPS